MKSKILLYVGSIVIILWGVSHIVPTCLNTLQKDRLIPQVNSWKKEEWKRK